MKTKKKTLRRIFCLFLCLCILGITALTVINTAVKLSTEKQILTAADAAKLEGIDCILVLGCGVREDGTPSDMLCDRLTRGVELYEAGAAPKLLMSGDHGRVEYDEVAVMKQFAVDRNIPSENVFMDHAGFSTYESMHRARDIFQCERVIIVTQTYHLYRAIHDARAFGMEAVGISSDLRSYARQTYFDIREAAARIKDWVWCIVKVPPTYLGEAIPIFGNGDVTNDR